jgi:hypothetical protein
MADGRSPNPATRGMGLMVLANLVLSVLDTSTKWLVVAGLPAF